MKISTILLTCILSLLNYYSIHGQSFLTRQYLKSLPGSNINYEDIDDASKIEKIDSANSSIFKKKFFNEEVSFKGVKKKNFVRLRESKIIVIPIWRFNGNKIAAYLQVDSTEEENDTNARLSGTLDKDAAGTLYTELLSDFTGLWRISLASAITSQGTEDSAFTETSSTKDIQNFFAGGGNIIAKASIPLILIYSNRYRHTRNTGVFFVPKAAVSFPAFGTTASDPTWNIDAGLEAETYAGGISEEIGFYGRIRVAGVWATRDFTKQLLDDERRLFGYGQASVGTLIQEKLYINLNFPVSVPVDLFGHEDPIDKMPVYVSAGVLF